MLTSIGVTSHIPIATMETKILGTVLENFVSRSLTYVIIGCSIICTSLNTLMPITENGPPLPPPNNVGMKKPFHRGQAKVYRAAQTATLLGGRGERGRKKGISC